MVGPRPGSVVVALLMLGTPAAAADRTGTWTLSGVDRIRVCRGGRCGGATVLGLNARLTLKRDGTYRIPGGICARTRGVTPDETGTWRTAHGRIILQIGNAAEMATALGNCFDVAPLTVHVMRSSLGSRSIRGCPRVRSGERLCGARTLKGVGGTARMRFQSVARFVATRDPGLGRCGDGGVDPGEACDDGNLADGDGCSSSCEAICQPALVTSTWQGIQTRIFAGHACTQAVCHGGGSPVGLDLRPEAAYASLVDVPSTQAPAEKRVAPGSAETSLLWQKLVKGARGGGDDVPGAGMPVGAAPLDADELEAVRRWIAAGAPATGIVADTDRLLAGCAAAPADVDPLPPPAASEGIQLYAPPWAIPARGEDEVCYPTYYDFSAQIPAGNRVPCPAAFGGPAKECFYYHRTELTQSPNSHHSIIHVYSGRSDVTDPSFGPFTCHGGAHEGLACDPKALGVAAPAGADCGPRAACAGSVQSTVACIGYGPSDFVVDIAGIGGSQEPHSTVDYPAGVFSVLPVRGVVVWNSHAFNLGDRPVTNEQWFNVYFAGAADRRYPAQGIFDARFIFVQDVPPFAQREYCATATLPQGAALFDLGSHTHKRGTLFRIWGPGVTACSPPDCPPESGAPIALTTQYTHPIKKVFDPPLVLPDAAMERRTFKYCSLYDNGFTDPGSVRRASSGRGTICFGGELACLDGPKRGAPCHGDDRACDSTPGARDGRCDACPVKGGVTTEDEMFILLGAYYCPEGSACWVQAP